MYCMFLLCHELAGYFFIIAQEVPITSPVWSVTFPCFTNQS